MGIDGGLTLFQAARDTGPFAFAHVKYELHPLAFGPLGEPAFTAGVVAHLLSNRLLGSGVEANVVEGFSITPDWGSRSDRPGMRLRVDMSAKLTLPELDLIFVGIGSRGAGLLQRELHAGLSRGVKMPARYVGISSILLSIKRATK